MRGVNPHKESYHHSVIREFSDTSRFMMSGVTRGFVRNRYAWFADFMNKFESNLSFNKHVAYLSFFSDQEIFISEYANVKKVTDIYPCILNSSDSILSNNYRELSTGQYSKISQKFSGFDVVELINESKLTTDAGVAVLDINKYHSFYYAPVIFETGYKIDKGDIPPTDPSYQIGHDLYIWSCGNTGRYASTLIVNDYDFNLSADLPGGDYGAGPTHDIITLVGLGNFEKKVDYKIIPINSMWSFFEDKEECVCYPYMLEEGSLNSHRNYLGIPLIFSAVERSLVATDRSCGSKLFPQVVFNNIVERQKVVSFREGDAFTGRMAFHSGGLSEEETDQSLLTYNISAYCAYDFGDSTFRVGQKLIEDPSVIICGIDINTERNRRYSAVVSTQPYMGVTALSGGEVVEYKFVKYDGTDLEYGTFEPHMVLKIKASRPFIRSLDVELGKADINDDIIHTISIKDPVDAITSSDESNKYCLFRGMPGSSAFYHRQESSVDDLVGGITGVGNYFSFGVPEPEADQGYSGGKARVSGIGHYVRTLENGTTEEYARLYCSNYIPGGATEIDLTFTADSHTKKELFRPMLKVFGLNGYIKIINRSRAHKAKILDDGSEEVTYDVEFPYCPGSYYFRKFSESVYQKTQIFYKSAYINAGSHAIDSEGRHNSYNARYVPIGEKAFSRIDAFINSVGDIESDMEMNGGGVYHGAETALVAKPGRRIVYPGHLVYSTEYPVFLWLTKPKIFDDTGLGTFELAFSGSAEGPGGIPVHLGDLKLVWHVDNRMWRYDENKYSSYINRECPSYVFEIDASELSNEFGRKQYRYGGIPELKRWIYSKVIGFCSTAIDPSTSSDEDNTDGTRDISTNDSSSDMLIEIWDNSHVLGSLSTRSMWRPFTISVYDSLKHRSVLLLDGLHCEGTKTPVYVPDGLYSVVLGKFNSDTLDAGLSLEEIEAVSGASNLVLYDSGLKKTFHVAYVIEETSDALNTRLIAYLIMDAADTLSQDESALDPSNWTGPISIQKPYSKLNKNTNFEFNSSEVSESEMITRYMDFGDKQSEASDFKRFVNNGKIYVRVRPAKARTYPVSYSKVGTDVMQWMGSYVFGSVSADSNFPWYDVFSASYFDAFDWSRIDLVESVRRMGLNYFTLQSK